MADTGAAIERARDKTEEMQARASAMDELIASGTLEDFTSGGETQLDRELAQLTSKSKVDDELAKMKAEIGSGSGSGQKELAAAPSTSPTGTRSSRARSREGRDGRELAAARRRRRLHDDRRQPRADRPGPALDSSPLARRVRGDRLRARRLGLLLAGRAGLRAPARRLRRPSRRPRGAHAPRRARTGSRC